MASPAKEAKVRDLFQNLRRHIDHEDFLKAYKASNDVLKNLGEGDDEKAADARRARAYSLYRLDRWNDL